MIQTEFVDEMNGGLDEYIGWPDHTPTFKAGRNDIGNNVSKNENLYDLLRNWVNDKALANPPENYANWMITRNAAGVVSVLPRFLQDNTHPKGEIIISDQRLDPKKSWAKISNDINSNLFLKDQINNISIKATDGNFSVTEVAYAVLPATSKNDVYQNEKDIEADNNISWTYCTGGDEDPSDVSTKTYSIDEINAPGTVIIYARITDEAGNVTYINSDILAVYKDPDSQAEAQVM